MSAEPKFVIVVGASAGGLNGLIELVSQLKTGMDAAIFVVMHLSGKGVGDFLSHRLQQFTSLICQMASHGASIHKGHIYIAPPDHHLLVKEKRMIIGNGPEENRWRPSIDVLFRSAAVAYGNHSIGVILTGQLDDGTTGMSAIKRSGGICIVQDPNEAEYPDMPLSVLNQLEVDYCISLSEMGLKFQELTRNGGFKNSEVPADIKAEAIIAEKVATGTENVIPIGEQTGYSCPDCGNNLWNVTPDNISRFQCHIGHSYSEKDLVLKQAHQLKSTLWVALRMMEDRQNLLHKLAQDSKQRGSATIAAGHEGKEHNLQIHIDKLKEILFSTQENNP